MQNKALCFIKFDQKLHVRTVRVESHDYIEVIREPKLKMVSHRNRTIDYFEKYHCKKEYLHFKENNRLIIFYIEVSLKNQIEDLYNFFKKYHELIVFTAEGGDGGFVDIEGLSDD